MSEEADLSQVVCPKTIEELLVAFDRNPDACLFAGGTGIVPGLAGISGVGIGLPPEVIYLGDVGELDRISRTERFLEIGAAVSIAKILSVGKNAVPDALYDALVTIASPAVRNLATLGGNICTVSPHGDSMPALHVLDAVVELRKRAKSVWTPISQLFDESGTLRLGRGELVARVRIPYHSCNIHIWRRITEPKSYGRSIVSMCATARLARGTLSDLRLAFGALTPRVFRSRQLEAKLIGQRLPLPTKEQKAFVAELEERLDPLASGASAYARATAKRLATWLLERL